MISLKKIYFKNKTLTNKKNYLYLLNDNSLKLKTINNQRHIPKYAQANTIICGGPLTRILLKDKTELFNIVKNKLKILAILYNDKWYLGNSLKNTIDPNKKMLMLLVELKNKKSS